jgi:glycosyltransferase involved in cell wall biosynthesis
MTETTTPTGTVLVPAYNEDQVVGPSLVQIADTLARHSDQRSWEIVVVDDGSADATAVEAEAAGAHLAKRGIQVRVIRHVANRGLGAALQTGFAASTGDVVVVIDCDLSYSPDHIPRLVDALVQGQAKMAIASPYMAGGATVGVPRHLERRSRMANRFLSNAVHGEVETLTGMVRAYDGPFIRGLALKAPDADINLETIYKTMIMRGRIVEIPAVLDWSGLESRAGRSRIASPRTRFKVYKTLLDGVLFRPYIFFGLAGIAMILGGIAVGLLELVLGNYVELSVLAICAVTTGLMMCFAGLLSIQIKRSFEELFFQAGRDRVGATVVDTRAPAVVPPAAPAVVVPTPVAPSLRSVSVPLAPVPLQAPADDTDRQSTSPALG